MDVAHLEALLDPASRERAGAITASLVALGGSLVLVGTSEGSLLAYTLGPRSASAESAMKLTGTLLFSQRIHCGPVHDVTLSCTQLVAIGGHDAVCAVLALGDVLTASAQPSSASAVSLLRLTGHRMPVVCVRFFSDGCTLASLAVDGQLIVFDAVCGEIRTRLRCGFPARTLALSADETCCFIGGKMLARVDLFDALRAEQRSTFTSGPYQAVVEDVDDAPQPWLRLCCWPATQKDGGGKVYVAEGGTFIHDLRVSRADGSVTALFARTTSKAAPHAYAQWHFTSPSPLLADVCGSVDGSAPAVVREASDSREWGSVVDVMSERAREESVPLGSSPPPPWRTALGQIGGLPWRVVAARVQQLTRRASGARTESAPLSMAQRLAEAKAQQRALQQQCDALAQRLRHALSEKGVKS